jgi:hypothetical protein
MPKLQKLGVYEFGRRLVETNDLDPVYVLLWEAGMETRQLEAWLLAYWCFYDMGTASWIAESYFDRGTKASTSFWDRMDTAAKSKDYPWISFKVADMLERLDLCRVEFNDTAMFLFDSPRKGAELMEQVHGTETRTRGATLPTEQWAVASIISRLACAETGDKQSKGYYSLLAPPRLERLLGPQEAETILCKWHSYRKGHYQLGEDIEACNRSLSRFKDRSKLAQRLYRIATKTFKIQQEEH